MMSNWQKARKWKKIISQLKGTALKANFISAIQKCHWDVILACVDAGIDINCHVGDRTTALHIACGNGNLALVGFLLRQPTIDVDRRDGHLDTALAMACRHGYADIVRMLLEADADVDLANNMEDVPLHHACMASNRVVVQMLLEYGATIDVQNTFHKTPLYIAAVDRPDAGIAQYLLDQGADPDVQDHHVMPLLLECCLYCRSAAQLDMVRLLLDNGVDVNSTEWFARRTALHIAALTGYVPLAELLMARGASLSALDRRCKRPFDVARQHHRHAAHVFREPPVADGGAVSSRR